MKFIVKLLIVVLFFISCNKKKDNQNNQTTTNPSNTDTSVNYTNPLLGPLPSTFTQKALIEYRTGIWCGACPSATSASKACVNAFPDNLIIAAYHTPPGNNIEAIFNSYDANTLAMDQEISDYFLHQTGTPAGVVNRDVSSTSYSNWLSMLPAKLNKTATSGLAISSKKINATQYEIEVHCGFNIDFTGAYHLVTYVLEDSVHRGLDYNQRNYGNTNSGSEWYGKGDPMPKEFYKHNNTIVQSLDYGIWGKKIPETYLKANKEYALKYTLDINPIWNENNLSIVSFISKFNNVVAKISVENVQKTKLGENKKWD